MKQILKSFAILALVAVSVSCAKERISAPSGEDAVVSFTVSAPVLQTKAIADGTTVDKVACCVYNSDGDLIEKGISQTVPMTGKSATFSTRLVTGQTYSFLFWAYKSKGGDGDDKDDSAYYTLDKGNKKVTVSYTGAKSNDESRDAFYAYVAPREITGAVNETVKLYRPFAQLNFGVEKDDIAAAGAAGIFVAQSKVKITNLATELDLTTGKINEGKTTTAEFDFAACPTTMTNPASLSGELLTVNDNAYGYVAMNYVLVGKDTRTLAKADLTIKDADGNEINTLKVNDVPLLGNYRTNVVGNLFTSAVNLSIVVEPAFLKPDYEKEIWDGQINAPGTDDAGNYLITKPSELAWVAQQVNSGAQKFKDKTIQLQNDIDLCNGNWTPIGTGTYPFNGTFDGQGHTISNLNVYSTKASDALGLFGHVTFTNLKNFTVVGAKVISEVVLGSGASCGVAVGSKGSYVTVEGITVKNAVVTSNHYVGGVCGNGYGNITNCIVDGATLTALPTYLPNANPNSKTCTDYDFGDKVGGIIGILGEGAIKITGCKVSNVTIYGYRDLGGISGIAQNKNGTPEFSDNVIGENVFIYVDATYNYNDIADKASFNANSVIGRKVEGVIETNSSGTATIYYPDGFND